jgi:hypothetical protein
MDSVYDLLMGFFERDGWQCHRLEAYNAIEMGVAGDNGNYRMVALVDTERSIVRFLTFVEGRVPETRRREVMEFLTRANYGLLLGNFELDLSDGEVRFKCALDVEESELSYKQYHNMLYVSLATMDRYYPGLQRVVQGSADAAAAIADIEHWEG